MKFSGVYRNWIPRNIAADQILNCLSAIQENRKLTIEASKKAREIQNQDIYLSFILKLDTEMKKLQVFYTEIGYAGEIRSCSYLWDAENCMP